MSCILPAARCSCSLRPGPLLDRAGGTCSGVPTREEGVIPGPSFGLKPCAALWSQPWPGSELWRLTEPPSAKRSWTRLSLPPLSRDHAQTTPDKAPRALPGPRPSQAPAERSSSPRKAHLQTTPVQIFLVLNPTETNTNRRADGARGLHEARPKSTSESFHAESAGCAGRVGWVWREGKAARVPAPL